MRIAFLTPWDVVSDASWSGVVAPMFRAVGSWADVIPVQTGEIRDAFVDRALTRALDGRWGRYLPGHALATAWKRSLVASRLTHDARPDVVLAVAASQDLTFLKTNAPVIQVSDTTFTAIRGYYPLYSHLNPLSSMQGSAQARLSVKRVAHTLAASEWAKAALIRHDGIPASAITVAPFGPAVEQIAEPPSRALREHLEVLLVASDWERKGGPAVLRAVTLARDAGADIRLTIIGDAPVVDDAWVHHMSRVPRSQLARLYASSDVLVELAQSSAAGVVLTDAAAAGLPVIARRTGGVETIVADGGTGFLVDGADPAVQAADCLVRLTDGDLRARMGRSARQRHSALLNWDTWADTFLRVCRTLVAAR